MTKKWSLVKLGEILTERKDKPNLYAILSGEIPIVSKIGFDTGRIEIRNQSKTKTDMILIKPGDLVISGINALKGAVAIYEDTKNKPAAATIHYSSYIINEKKADPYYLWYFLRSKIFREILINNLPKGIKTEVKPKRFLYLEILLPTIEEQKCIVEKNNVIIALIKEAQSIKADISGKLQQLFPKIVEKKIPYYELDNLSSVLNGKPRNGYSARCDALEGGTPVLSLTSVLGFHYKPDFKLTSEPLDPHAHYWLNPGDFLISRSNTLNLVGHAAIYSGEPYPCIYPDLLMRIPINAEKVDKKFLLYWSQTPLVRKFIMDNAKGTSPTMKKISQKIVMKIPFPSKINLNTQRQIIGFIDSIQEKLNKMECLQAVSEEEVEELMPSILEKLFKGNK